MTCLAAADLTPSGIQIESCKSPEENINKKFDDIVKQNAFRGLADVSHIYLFFVIIMIHNL